MLCNEQSHGVSQALSYVSHVSNWHLMHMTVYHVLVR